MKKKMTWEELCKLKDYANDICKMYEAEADNLLIEGQINSEQWFKLKSLLNERYFEISKDISDIWFSGEKISEEAISLKFKELV